MAVESDLRSKQRRGNLSIISAKGCSLNLTARRSTDVHSGTVQEGKILAALLRPMDLGLRFPDKASAGTL